MFLWEIRLFQIEGPNSKVCYLKSDKLDLHEGALH